MDNSIGGRAVFIVIDDNGVFKAIFESVEGAKNYIAYKKLNWDTADMTVIQSFIK